MTYIENRKATSPSKRDAVERMRTGAWSALRSYRYESVRGSQHELTYERRRQKEQDRALPQQQQRDPCVAEGRRESAGGHQEEASWRAVRKRTCRQRACELLRFCGERRGHVHR
ncbi:hypothetical protein PybrP1_005599 [[Pythium] brassicae (nom. inval.)]|nr:hypothetical protein PybrP1_005599 [[Pythium] brassicae (nom. inval.)]